MGIVAYDGMYYGGMGYAGNDMAGATTGTGLNWVLIAVIAGSVVLGIIVGILLGKRAMKKRDI